MRNLRLFKLKVFPLLSKLKLSQVMLFFHCIFNGSLSHSSISWSDSISQGHPKAVDLCGIALPAASLAEWACIWNLGWELRSRDSLSLCQGVLFLLLPVCAALPSWALGLTDQHITSDAQLKVEIWPHGSEVNPETPWLYLLSQSLWSTWQDGTHSLVG